MYYSEISKVYECIRVLKKAENPSNSMNELDDLRLHERWKMLFWCLTVFEKIVAKQLDKFLRVHTSRRPRLREFICRKSPQFWQSDYCYLLYDNTPAHRSQLVQVIITKALTIVLPHPLPLFTIFSSLGHLPIPINEKNIYIHVVLCHKMN
ncbi:hypothetical protein TNCV_2725141 [Trichonephila clavipes]|nr:hypothetical protein TNCV_2725141 [Trichonephila clavipes]